ncbi:MAG: hypothetical protein ACKV2T_24005 [Kofleriaceae bacterium]
MLDADEICDDGNNIATDDCSSDCRSTLSCGNNVLDDVVGEQCDDGNRTGLDGCDASCAVEQARWLEVGTPAPPWTGGLAFDAERGRSVLFADAGELGAQTWERYGWSWRRVPAQPPAGIFRVAFDRVKREVVGVAVGKAFRWDGLQWFPRGGAPARNLNDLIGSANTLYAISNVGEVFDLGGDLTTPVGMIPNTGSGGFITGFDPRNAMLVRHGGISKVPMTGGLPHVESFTSVSVTGATWQNAATGGPSAATAPAVWDARLQRLLVVGGQFSLTSSSAGVHALDTSSSNPAMWTWGAGGTLAAPRSAGVATHDPLRASTVLVGGGNGSTYSSLTEVLDASGWRGEVTTPDPTYLFEVPARGVVMAIESNNDVWSYNRDQGWRKHANATVPGAPTLSPAVFADSQARTLVWTANGSTCTISDDLAEPTTAWTCASSTDVISSRVDAATAYDENTHVGVLFGGQSSQWHADTYVWRNSAWVAAPMVTFSSSCLNPQLVHDTAARKFVLFCKQFIGSSIEFKAWSWNGDEATPWSPEPAPPLDGVPVFNRDLGQTMLLALHGATYLLESTGWKLEAVEQRRVLPLLKHAAYLSADRETVAMSDATMFILTWESAVSETCLLGNDHDGDGLAGCADPDCWARCNCGDGTISVLENCHNCPLDVGACPILCGDSVCSLGETSCPGDCGP